MIFLFSIILIIVFTKNDKLVFVETVFRHGARAPMSVKGEDIDSLGIKWPNPEELTPVGKRMHYLLGIYNRRRYITEKYKFLSPTIDPHELIVFSSDVNRTLLSVYSQLQGWYPMSQEYSDKILPEQEAQAFPPLKVNKEDYKEEIDSLKDGALPNYMNLIPVHPITLRRNDNECKQKSRELINENAKKFENYKKFEENFNKKYAKPISEFHKLAPDKQFSYLEIFSFYDALISDVAEGKDLTSFFETTGINKEEIMATQEEIAEIYFRDLYYGDENNENIIYYNTATFENLLYYMKRKVDDDIKGYPYAKVNTDFSRPKMVILSSHDTYLAGQEMFFIRYLGLEKEKFRFPSYASQINYEISRKDDDVIIKEKQSIKNLAYSDYTVSIYFNNEFMLNVTFDKFVKELEKVVWTKEQLDKFCGLSIFKINITTIVIIVLGALVGILLVVVIILIIKIKRKSSDLLSLRINKEQLMDDDMN